MKRENHKFGTRLIRAALSRTRSDLIVLSERDYWLIDHRIRKKGDFVKALAACRTWGYPAAWEGAGSSDSEPRWDQSGVLGQDGETEHRVEGAPGVGLALQGRLSLLKAH